MTGAASSLLVYTERNGKIAEKLKALAAGKPPWPSIDSNKAIPWVEKRTKLALAESQIEAVRVALASGIRVSELRTAHRGANQVQQSEFAGDSPLEEAVTSELVSEAQFPC
jgi:hypothetical protein